MAEELPGHPAVDRADDTSSFNQVDSDDEPIDFDEEPFDFDDKLIKAVSDRPSKKAREDHEGATPLTRKPGKALKFLEDDRACVEKYMRSIGEDRHWRDATDWFKATDGKTQEEIEQREAII